MTAEAEPASPVSEWPQLSHAAPNGGPSPVAAAAGLPGAAKQAAQEVPVVAAAAPGPAATVDAGQPQQLSSAKPKYAIGRQYNEVWTKESHNGAYVNCSAASAKIDPLTAGPSGALVRPRDEPGYEVAPRGPTGNFVGNHMTQGVIDLVQADLAAADPAAPLRAARLRAARGEPARPPAPVLIARGPAPRSDSDGPDAAAAVTAAEPLHAYSWADGTDCVEVRVPFPTGHWQLGAVSADVQLAARSARLTLRFASGPITPAEDAGPKRGERPAPKGRIFGLLLPRLFGSIDPAVSGHELRQACVVLRLVKAATAEPWPQLQAPLEISSLQLIAPPAHIPGGAALLGSSGREMRVQLRPPTEADLAALRKQVIVAREGRLALALAARMPGLLDADLDPSCKSTPAVGDAASAVAALGGRVAMGASEDLALPVEPPPYADAEAARVAGNVAFGAGAYEEAARCYGFGLALLGPRGAPGGDASEPAAILLTNRATARGQLGEHAGAARDCRAALTRLQAAAAAGLGDPAGTGNRALHLAAKASLRLGVSLEALEQPAAAAEAYRAVQPGHGPAAQKQAAAGLARALRAKAQAERAAGQ